MTRKLTPEERLKNQTAVERLNNQLIRGQCRIGNEAAREIARRVTDGHGFWDFEERKLAQQARDARPVFTLIRGGQSADDLAA